MKYDVLKLLASDYFPIIASLAVLLGFLFVVDWAIGLVTVAIMLVFGGIVLIGNWAKKQLQK